MLHQGFSRASFDLASEIASVTRRVARVFRGRALPFLDGAAVFCSARLYDKVAHSCDKIARRKRGCNVGLNYPVSVDFCVGSRPLDVRVGEVQDGMSPEGCRRMTVNKKDL